MKRLFFTSLLIACSLLWAKADDNNSISCKVQGTSLNVTFFSPEIVHVVRYPENASGPTRKSLVVTMKPDTKLHLHKTESSSKITMGSNVLTVTVDKRSGLVQFLSKGKNLLREKSFEFEERQSGPDKGAYRVTQV